MTHKKLNEELSDSERPVQTFDFPLDKTALSSLFGKHEIDSGDASTAIKNFGLIPGLVSQLRSDAKAGLNSKDQNDLNNREQFYGKNNPIIAEQKSLWELVKILYFVF